MTASIGNATDVVEQVLQILDEGSTVATYKFAVLLALLDVCIEATDQHGEPPVSVTTRQLADKVIELYWRQARPWGGDKPLPLLRQNASKGLEIVARVHEFRAQVERDAGVTAPVVRARLLDPQGWRRLLDDVEWKLIEMPIPKLQRVRGQSANWLYAISWDDGVHAPTASQVRAYQRNPMLGTFDNQLRLMPGVGFALTRLHGLLRPFIQQQWAAKVASLNALEEARLPQFLFGSERISLEPVRAGLVELQKGLCFYCSGKLGKGLTHVDHFLPWARHPDDALANLVAADQLCNENKRDYLANHRLVGRWRTRLEAQATGLGQVGAALDWEVGQSRVLGAARAIYLPLPDDSRVWAGRHSWEPIDRLSIQTLLG